MATLVVSRAAAVLTAALLMASGVRAQPSARTGIDAGAALRRVSLADETLSPMRYRGTGAAFVASVALRLFATDWLLRGNYASTGLSSSQGEQATFDTEAIELALEGSRPLRWSPRGARVDVGAITIFRLAGRRHDLVLPPTALSFGGLEANSFDGLAAAGPAVVVRHSLGAGIMSWRGSAALAGWAWHPYRPVSIASGAPARFVLAGDLTRLESSLAWEAPRARRLAVGAAYSYRLLALRRDTRLAESQHELAATLGWRRAR